MLYFSVPIGKASQFVSDASVEVKAIARDGDVLFLGHLGDSNLHAIMGLKNHRAETKFAVEKAMYEVVQRYSGSISAEHGIGLVNVHFWGCRQARPR